MKQRSISWILIPLMLVGFVCKAIVYNNADLKNILLNIAFIVIQLLLLTIYMSIKNKKWMNIVNTYLGSGDVLFFVVICVAFSFLNFIAFYVLSLIVTMIGVITYNVVSKKQTRDIPLAGAMAASLIVLMLVPGWNFYDDGYLINMINKF